jgi:hypothetical protein
MNLFRKWPNILKWNEHSFPIYRRLCKRNEKDYREKVRNCKDRKRHYSAMKVSNFGTVTHRCSNFGEAQLLCHSNGVMRLQAYSQHTCPCKTYLGFELEIPTHIIPKHLPWHSHLLLSTTDCLYQICNRKSNCRANSCFWGQVPWYLPQLVALQRPSLQQNLFELSAKNRGKGKTVSGELLTLR